MHKLHIISGQHEDGGSGTSQLKKGILWQQRDKIFSRWKERFFVLTKDYLQCFKKGTSRITEMGGFIYGIRLSDVSFFFKIFMVYCTILVSNLALFLLLISGKKTQSFK